MRQLAGPASSTTAATPSESPLPQHRWFALAVIATAQLMIALDATVVNIALPSVQSALAFSDADRQWIITAYTLSFGGLLLLGGRMADSTLIGRRGALLIGLVGFAAASALSGAATSLPMLVASRALQGAFAALLAPTALSTLALIFTDRQERARAFGVYGAIAASGGAIGLLLGGLLTQYVDWRWCLYINVPIALCAAFAARALLPDTRRAHSSESQFDLLGLLLGSTALITLVYAGAQISRVGWSSASLLALGSAVLFALFLRQESRAPAPLLPLGIVRDRQRGAAYLSALLAVAGMFGAFLFLTYELQSVLGFSPLEAGLAFLPMSLASLLAGTVVAPRLLPRVAPRLLIAPGFVLAALGMGVLTQLRPDSTYLTGVLPAEILLGLGVASVMMPASSLATSRVDQRVAGVASAVLNSAQQIGASLGTAILNSVAAAVTAAVIALPRAEAQVQGAAAAATVAAAFLLLGAAAAWLMLSAPEPKANG